MKSSACNFADRPWPKKLFRPSCSGKPRFITSYPKQLRKYFYTMCNFKFYLSLLKSFNRLNRIPTSTTDTYNRLNQPWHLQIHPWVALSVLQVCDQRGLGPDHWPWFGSTGVPQNPERKKIPLAILRCFFFSSEDFRVVLNQEGNVSTGGKPKTNKTTHPPPKKKGIKKWWCNLFPA